VLRDLTSAEVLELHRLVLAQAGGATGLRDLGALEAAVTQPRQSFAGRERCPTLSSEVAALGFGLVASHPFVDGNRRVGHAAMDSMLLLDGAESCAPVEEAEAMILRVGSSGALRWADY
jgi:death-on-curing protein